MKRSEMLRFNLGMAAVCAVIVFIVRENTTLFISQIVGLYLCAMLIIINRQQKKLRNTERNK